MGLFNKKNSNSYVNYNIDEIENNNRQVVCAKLENIPNVDAPAGWKRIEIAVGGLLYIGFSDVDTKKLICISSQGQSVINCETGEVDFCDENYDEFELTAIAEELGNEIVHIAGIGGGGLRHYSRTGDMLVSVAPQYPIEKIIFEPNYKSCFTQPEDCLCIYKGYEIRAYGFSRCGNYIAVCDSADLIIFKRV